MQGLVHNEAGQVQMGRAVRPVPRGRAPDEQHERLRRQQRLGVQPAGDGAGLLQRGGAPEAPPQRARARRRHAQVSGGLQSRRRLDDRLRLA